MILRLKMCIRDRAMAGVLAYNLAENDNKIIFDYSSNAYQDSHSIEDELEM